MYANCLFSDALAQIFYFNSVLRPHQDYFSSYETGQSVGVLKTGEPREKPPDTPTQICFVSFSTERHSGLEGVGVPISPFLYRNGPDYQNGLPEWTFIYVLEYFSFDNVFLVQMCLECTQTVQSKGVSHFFNKK